MPGGPTAPLKTDAPFYALVELRGAIPKRIDPERFEEGLADALGSRPIKWIPFWGEA